MDTADQNLFPLQHQRSTKQLISRFESMSRTTRSRSAQPASNHRPLAPKQTQSEILRPPRRDKLPLRESFRNLFLAFRKGTGIDKIKSDDNFVSSTRYSPRPASLTASIKFSTGKFSSAVPTPSILATPTPLFSGPLLYLCQTSHLSSADKSALPVWMNCTAALDANNIVISWFTTQGSLVSRAIRLSNCADIRSLSRSQLNLEEDTALSTEELRDVQVFEIQFEGRARERFAATSVQERAGWISAIWDAVLPAQEIENFKIMSVPRNPISALSSDAQRSLPPIPLDSTVNPTKSNSSVHLPLSFDVNSPRASSSFSSSHSSRFNIQSNSPERSCSAIHSSEQIEHTPVPSATPSLGSPRVNENPQVPTLPAFVPFSVKPNGQKGTRLFSDDSYCGLAPIHIDHKLKSCDFQEDRADVLRSASDQPNTNSGPLAPLSIVSGRTTGKYARNSIPRDHPGYDFRDISPRHAKEPDVLSIYQLVAHLEQKTDRIGETLELILQKLDTFRTHYKEVDPLDETGRKINIHEALKDMHMQLDANLSLVKQELCVVKTAQIHSTKAPSRIMKNVASSTLEETKALTFVDPSFIQTKSDELLAGRSLTSMVGDQVSLAPSGNSELSKILTHIREDIEQRTYQIQQQADCARYLNELNMWLESFVNNSNSQIQGLTAGIEQLHIDLGYSSRISTTSHHVTSEHEVPSLMADLRQIIHEKGVTEQNIAMLQASLNGLIDLSVAESRRVSDTDSIAILIEQRHRDQEDLIRALTGGLSEEIKGERLRFVEAMKEATAINVQLHVEQFKKELTREVMSMTEEVGRLHREKQATENQIADLFAFYSKQKLNILPAAKTQVSPQQSPSSESRPLPEPKYR